jgi:hypothetical protein
VTSSIPRLGLPGHSTLVASPPDFGCFNTSIRQYSTMSASTASSQSGENEIRTRTQQSPLASQRAKEQAEKDGRRRGPFSGNLFPMGYKEGFSQWVRNCAVVINILTDIEMSSGQISHLLLLSTEYFLTSHIFKNLQHIPKPAQPHLP